MLASPSLQPLSCEQDNRVKRIVLIEASYFALHSHQCGEIVVIPRSRPSASTYPMQAIFHCPVIAYHCSHLLRWDAL